MLFWSVVGIIVNDTARKEVLRDFFNDITEFQSLFIAIRYGAIS